MPEAAKTTPTTNEQPQGRTRSPVRQGLSRIPSKAGSVFKKINRVVDVWWTQNVLPKTITSGITLENKLRALEEARKKRVLWEIPVETIVDSFLNELVYDLGNKDEDARGALKFASTYLEYTGDEQRKAFAKAITIGTNRLVPFRTYCSLMKAGLRFPLVARLKIVERAYAEDLARPEDVRHSSLQQALALFPETRKSFEVFDGRFRRKSEL